MPRIAPEDFVDGTTLEPWHLNYILSFIRRWSKFDAAAPLSFDQSGESPPHLSFQGEDELIPIQTPAGGIAAATSLAAPGSGTVKLLIEYQGGPGFDTTTVNTATCYNPYAQAVGASKFGWAKWRGPYLYIVVWDC